MDTASDFKSVSIVFYLKYYGFVDKSNSLAGKQSVNLTFLDILPYIKLFQVRT